MNRQMTCGTSSISFQNPVFIQSCASVVSRKEGEGPLGAYFDTICEDPMFGTDTWEAAESTLQKQAALLRSKKTASPVPIYSFFLQATCWLRHQHLLSEPLI